MIHGIPDHNDHKELQKEADGPLRSIVEAVGWIAVLVTFAFAVFAQLVWNTYSVLLVWSFLMVMGIALNADEHDTSMTVTGGLVVHVRRAVRVIGTYLFFRVIAVVAAGIVLVIILMFSS